MNLDVLRTKERLDHLFDLAANFREPEMQAHWARYLCVLTSGYLERSVRLILSDYAKAKAAPYIANYVESELRSFQSAKMENIYKVLRTFSPTWQRELEAACDDQIRDSVDSIVTNRHSIAHGENVGISLGTLRGYYRGAVKFVEILDTLCRP